MDASKAIREALEKEMSVPQYELTILMKDGTEHKKTTRTNDLQKAVNDFKAWCIAPDDMHKIESINTRRVKDPILTQII